MADEPVIEPETPVTAPVETVEQPHEASEIPAEAAPAGDEVISEEGEPGGSSAQEVRARKEYRARKGVERQLESERLERVRLEERLRTLEEVRQQQPVTPPQKIFTPAEVQSAIDSNQVSASEGAAYLARIEAQKIIQEDRQAQAALKPFERAASEVTEYMNHLPWTKDRMSPEFQVVAKEYESLVRDYGFANDIRTQRIALERVAGPLDKLKARAQVAQDTRTARVNSLHSETPASGAASVSKANDISKAPELMQRMWNRTGTSQADREKEYRYHLQRQKT